MKTKNIKVISVQCSIPVHTQDAFTWKKHEGKVHDYHGEIILTEDEYETFVGRGPGQSGHYTPRMFYVQSFEKGREVLKLFTYEGFIAKGGDAHPERRGYKHSMYPPAFDRYRSACGHVIDILPSK